MKYLIKSTLKTLEKEGTTDFQARWDFLKYEVRKFSIEFSKLLAYNSKKIILKTRNYHIIHTTK